MLEDNQENHNPQPTLRLETPDGIAWYPRFVKNTQGEWELKDKSFLKLLEHHIISGSPLPEKTQSKAAMQSQKTHSTC